MRFCLLGDTVGDELLDTIFGLESLIQGQLAGEKERAERWLAGVRAEEQQSLEAARRRFKEQERRILARARGVGEARAETIRKRELDYCARLGELSDAVLAEVLERKLDGILPGAGNDHQNGEN